MSVEFNENSVKELFSVIGFILREEELPDLSLRQVDEVIAAARQLGAANILASSELFLEQCSEEQKKLLSAYLFSIVRRQAIQEFEFERICNALNENGIAYVPLKGILLRHLYPKKEMRPSGDIDLLYDAKYRKKLRTVFPALGYEKYVFDPNHDVFCKDKLNVEMHHNLLLQFPQFFAYYKGIWKKLVPTDSFEYRFTPEDTYAYQLAHTMHHFLSGEGTIFAWLDLYLIRRKMPLNEEKLSEILKELDIFEFEKKFYGISVKLLEEGELTEEETQAFRFFLTNREDQSLTFSDYKKGRGKRGIAFHLSRIFPPFFYMREKYICLQKVPLLLPVMWLVRICHFIGRRIQKRMSGKKAHSVKNVYKEDSVSIFRTLGL